MRSTNRVCRLNNTRTIESTEGKALIPVGPYLKEAYMEAIDLPVGPYLSARAA